MLPASFKKVMQIAVSPYSNDERAEMVNNADELLVTKGIIFDYSEHQKRKQIR